MSASYSPPFTLTAKALDFVVQISEAIGSLAVQSESPAAPALRRGNRLKTIQASLEIEHNSLTLEQVTAVVSGKRVLGPAKEIQEVHNAFAAYEAMDSWKPWRAKDFLQAHKSPDDGAAGAAWQLPLWRCRDRPGE